MKEIVRIISGEGDKYEVPLELAKLSNEIKEIIEYLCEENNEEKEITFYQLKSSSMKKIIEFMYLYGNEPIKEIKKPLITNKLEELVQEQYVNYINVDTETLIELSRNADYLNIGPLLDLCCTAITCKIINKTTEEIKSEFGLKDVIFTPEEIKRAKDEIEEMEKCRENMEKLKV